MSFDAISLKLLILESKNDIIGRTVDKIIEHRKNEFAFILRNAEGPSTLYISVNPNFPIFFYTIERKINFNHYASNYWLSLKKHLEGARIIDVFQLYCDRILIIKFLKKDSFSEKPLFVVFEFMGKHSNSFIYAGEFDAATLLGDHVTAAITSSENLCAYISKAQKNEITLIADEANALSSEIENLMLSGECIKKYTGISPFLLKAAKTPFNLSEIARIFACKNFQEFTELKDASIKNKYSIFNIYNTALYSTGAVSKNNKKFVYPFDLRPANNDVRLIGPRECLNEANADYFAGFDGGCTNSKMKNRVTKLYDIAAKKKATFASDMDIAKDFELHLKYGQLIISILATCGDELKNAPAENIEIFETSVPLDPRYSLADNAQRHFKLYKRLKSKHDHAKKAFLTLNSIMNEIEEFIKTFDSENNIGSYEFYEQSGKKIAGFAAKLIFEDRQKKKFLSELYGEVKNAKSLLNKKSCDDGKKNVHENQNSKYYRLFSTKDGYLIYVGKSDIGNDFILSKIAMQEDYWFHVKDFRGSSVILKSPKGAETQTLENAVKEAAMYAAYYSQGRNATKIFVSCAKRKYVKKLKRVPGKVTFSCETTILIDVNELEAKFGTNNG